MAVRSLKFAFKPVLVPILLALVTFLGFAGFYSGSARAESIFDIKICNKALVGDIEASAKTSTAIDWDATVVVDHQQINADGDTEYVLKKVKGAWFSVHRPEDIFNAPQGDPRGIIHILGRELAAFLGIKMISSTKMIIPATETLNRNIEKLNVLLARVNHKPITVRFYTTSDKLETDEDYNKAFAYQTAFPISADLTLYVHDVSYHLASFVFPANIVEDSVGVASALYKFLDYVHSKKDAGTKQDQFIKNWAYGELHSKQTETTDFLFGNSVETIRRMMIQQEDPSLHDLINEWLQKYFTEKKNQTIKTVLLNRIETLDFVSSPDAEQIDGKAVEDILENLLSEFITLHPEIAWDKSIPAYDAKRMLSDTRTRIMEFKKALLE